MSSPHHGTCIFRLHPLTAALRRARFPLLMTGRALLCLAGPALGAPVELELSDLLAGDGSGFALNGAAVFDSSGVSVSAAGDVNGDGIDDVIIGAWTADPSGGQRGQSYVVFGKSTGFDAQLELSALKSANGGNGSAGFVLNGTKGGSNRVISVSAAGDVNGDGLGDVIFGAHWADPNGYYSGQSYVVFGESTGFAAELELSALESANGGNGTLGFVLNGADVNDLSGWSVSAAGDVNGDGLGDVIIGAVGASSYAGQSYVVFGKSTGFAAELELSALKSANGGDGTRGYVLNGAGGFLGYSVSAAGDVNGDGIDDVIIGAPFAAPNGSLSGQSYVVFGKSTGFAAELELSALKSANGGNGSAGFVLNGINESDHSGDSVSAAGDVNGDGIDDVIIGAFRGDTIVSDSGQGYVVFGQSTGFAAELELSGLKSANGGNGSAGFVLNGAHDYAGRSVSDAGDVNGDGIADVIIGAPHGGGFRGRSYVVYGKSTGFAAELDLLSLRSASGGDGSAGFVVNGAAGSDQAGFSVSAAGDVNGDGIDDVLIGAPWASPNGQYSGQSYVVYGTESPTAAIFTDDFESGDTSAWSTVVGGS